MVKYVINAVWSDWRIVEYIYIYHVFTIENTDSEWVGVVELPTEFLHNLFEPNFSSLRQRHHRIIYLMIVRSQNGHSIGICAYLFCVWDYLINSLSHNYGDYPNHVTPASDMQSVLAQSVTY